MAAQSTWWLMKHITWIRHPIVIPIVIAVLALVGVTPSSIADVRISAFTYIGGHALDVVKNLSKSWLADPWLWFLPVLAMVIWFCHSTNKLCIDPNTEDSPRRSSPIKPPVILRHSTRHLNLGTLPRQGAKHPMSS